jgi:urease accessory protein
VRASESPDSKTQISDFALWQLADSAFPTGGFAHSSGLEAAWQHGEVRNRADLVSFIEASLHQLGHAALPFVTAAFDAPEKLGEFDQLFNAFTSNHVANRASRLQGRAFFLAVVRIFNVGQASRLSLLRGSAENSSEIETGATPVLTFAHFAPVFGACLRRLNMPRKSALRLFFFNHLRGLLAAAVRLHIVGPMEAQTIQHQLSSRADTVVQQSLKLGLQDVAQTAPLLDLWHGAQDRLYSRLFQS